MTDPKPIGVIQGAASSEVQSLLRAFIRRLDSATRVAGVMEAAADGAEGPCSAGDLVSLSDQRTFAIMQDLGSEATACRLDADGVVSACEAALDGIAAGCDLVILSKFGKIEAEGSGLAAAFARAIESGHPILTSVSPRFNAEWDRFAAPFYVLLPPEPEALDAWWRAVSARPGSAG